MSRLDIRTDETETIDEIRFGDNDCYTAVIKRRSDVAIAFMDVDDDSTNDLKIEDLDNFIKALQKAKELWA